MNNIAVRIVIITAVGNDYPMNHPVTPISLPNKSEITPNTE
jgi:hypothetical protein